jgi:hypothetical protein
VFFLETIDATFRIENTLFSRQITDARIGGHTDPDPQERAGAIGLGLVVSMAFRRCQTNERPNSFSKRSKSASTAGRSRVFFEKDGGFFSDVFHRQAMAVIGIENEAVGLLGGLEGVA